MSSPPSLLIVADSLDGGMGAVVRAHGRWFGAQGWRVVVAAPVRGQDAVDVPAALEPVDLPATARDVRSMLRAGRRLASVARDVSPTVVHCHGLRSFAATLATGRRPFVTVHGAGTVPTDPRGYRQVRQVVRIVIPRLARAAISAAPDVPGWRFLPHASPRLASLGRLPFPPAGQTPTFAWVGRVDEGKPGDEFVEALAALGRRRTVAGVVVGSGHGLARMEALAKRAGAPVQFVGEQDPEPFLERAWALVLFSRHEAVSFVAQEAMWAGRAVVASPLPGLRWLIGTTDALVENADQAAAVLDDLCDPIRARARGAAAAERIRGLLTPDDPWPAVAAMYRDHTA